MVNDMVAGLEPGQRIFPIAWHVDYWDYLGWTDPFGDVAYSNRQYHYANVIGAEGVYTPDMWINGEQVLYSTIFNDSGLQSIIDGWLDFGSHAVVDLTLESAPDAEPLEIGYEVTGAPDGTTLYLVLVERDVISVITAGENDGETLTHQNVARALVQTANTSGTIDIYAPGDVVPANCSVIGLVQQYSNNNMYGAGAIDLVVE